MAIALHVLDVVAVQILALSQAGDLFANASRSGVVRSGVVQIAPFISMTIKREAEAAGFYQTKFSPDVQTEMQCPFFKLLGHRYLSAD
ncbi:hypothetical protein [Leptolyngbya iicbica]|nr:hypothetical protein [Leptolyngbya sp. LK]